LSYTLFATTIPAVYSNLSYENDQLIAKHGGQKLSLVDQTPRFTLEGARGKITGTDRGLRFYFSDLAIAGGKLFYGLASVKEHYPLPRWKREVAIDDQGYAEAVLVKKLSGKYDFIDWERKKQGLLFYRVVTKTGQIVFEGKVFFLGNGPFRVDPGTIIEGPFLNQVSATSITLQAQTLTAVSLHLLVDGKMVQTKRGTDHEITIKNLAPNRTYDYVINAGGQHTERYHFTTAPKEGSRQPFTFAFTSDSRNGIASGERDIAGVNSYMMRKIGALMQMKQSRFLQFTGDMINGYNQRAKKQNLEYVNWKRSLLPFASSIPVYTSMGNHEALLHTFTDTNKTINVGQDHFPFATHSAEAIFANHFANPTNGPLSEDGSKYDLDPKVINFPSYKESVYSYRYDNMAMISLNSNYWYSPAVQKGKTSVGGNPHGYIMDNQLAWLAKQMEELSHNPAIDHIFVTLHTPVFPNGGHVKDDMFYDGNNTIRPIIAGKAVKQGIIERRDEVIRVVQKHPKFLAFLTGDEHNYARLYVQPTMPRYKGFLPHDPLVITRAFWQIHNGAAGAPYYALEQTPWNSDYTNDRGGKYLQKFSTQNAVVFFHIDGKRVSIEVINPDTLEVIDQHTLR
jgi:hypothetical protein